MATYNGSSANNTVVGALEQDNEFIGFGAGADVLTGGNRRDVFRMSFDPATDTVNGGAGQDMVDYSASSRGLQIDLNGSGNTGTVRFVTSLTYTPPGSTTPLTVTTVVPVANLSGIEDVVGSAYGDSITGSSLDNVLDGGNGGDTIKGLAGNDTLLGGYGSDKLFGGTGRNTIDGGNDADSITLELEHLGTTASRDTIAGGEGIDTLFFEESLDGDYGVRVTLDSGGLQGTVDSLHYTATGFMDRTRAEATLTGIENVTGTGQADLIQGNDQANVLNGMGGDDTLEGGAGLDTVNGGDGDDIILSSGDRVADVANGGVGTDTISFALAQTAVRVTLADGVAEGSATMVYSAPGPNGSPNLTSVLEERLISIENVIGTDLADTITGNGTGNELIGEFGRDTLSGAGGDDILDGGAGRDTLTGGADRDTFRVSHIGIGSDADRITDFASGQDKIDFSPFFSRASEFPHGAEDLPPPDVIGSQAFSGAGNELRLFTNSTGQSVVQVDLDGGGLGVNDIEIIVTGAVSVNDFLF